MALDLGEVVGDPVDEEVPVAAEVVGVHGADGSDVACCQGG
jgi:hypothetical protein